MHLLSEKITTEETSESIKDPNGEVLKLITRKNEVIEKQYQSSKNVSALREVASPKALPQSRTQPGRFVVGLSHINIAVPDLTSAISFYEKLLDATPLRYFENFRNRGFSKSAGFINNPDEVEVSIAFLEIPGAGLTLELMEYHNPQVVNKVAHYGVNEVCGVRHVALKVIKIDEAFKHVKSTPGITLINASDSYQPFRIDSIRPEEFRFHDIKLESDSSEKNKVCNIVQNIRYFYFIDPYGVQWEFEQGHSDMGTDET